MEIIKGRSKLWKRVALSEKVEEPAIVAVLSTKRLMHP